MVKLVPTSVYPRLAVTEAVFGVLLAALAVQLMVDGLAELGIVSGVLGH